MYYSEEIIEKVRTASPIVDIIGQYVHLEKKGANYFGLCPFHNEKSPSFSVSPSRQMFYCFGCGAGGNVVTFVMDYENYTFPEAIKHLADRAGIELPEVSYNEEEKREKDHRSVLLAMHKDAALFFVHVLKTEEGKPGLDYLKKRGLTDEMIRSFGLGYAGRRPDALYRYLKQKGYQDSDIKDSGLVSFRERGASDRFWNRVMFPIMDVNNRVIAFGGRVMGDGEPKYLNSPETRIFDKSRNLYGLNAARRSREKFFLICEGYMDVISLHQYGFTNAVASLGTAFTEQHGMILKRYTDEVICTFDSDGAGRKAALRAIPILKKAGLKIRVLDMSPYKDPDEFLRALGPEAYRERIRDARNAFLFELSMEKESYDFSDPEDKASFFNEAARRIAGFENEIERNSYTEAVARVYGIDYKVLKDQVSVIGNRVGIVAAREENTRPKNPSVKTLKSGEYGLKEAQKLLLTDLSSDLSRYESIRGLLSWEDFSDELYREAARLLFQQLQEGRLNPAAVLDSFIDSDRYREVSEVFSSSYADELQEEDHEQAFKEALRKVKENSLENQMHDAKDPEKLMELMKEKQELRQKIMKI
ncbi:MAG: DNA primase [Lachnospiraceae bacterium]|nr:DNA primase [Lachnospiraceae bacterium]